jgi:Fe2+ transport system protein B
VTAISDQIRQGISTGAHRGLRGFLWMIKILLPISFLTALLQWSGWLSRIDFLVHPVTSLLSLPSMAALPLIIGMLTNIYGGIAAMVILPFTREQMTLMAIFLLIAHNLIQEGVVQAKSGIHPLKATLFRLAAATITVLIVAPFLQPEATGPLTASTGLANALPFLDMLQNWALATLRLVVKIFLIIMGILTLLEVLKQLGWVDHVVRALTPMLAALGLSRKVGILWMTAVIFGLAYGAAVIVEEARRGDLTKDELELLHLSIGINHSMVEDPTLFLSLGLSAFWLWIPRLLMAMLAVRMLSLWHKWRLRERKLAS